MKAGRKERRKEGERKEGRKKGKRKRGMNKGSYECLNAGKQVYLL